MSAPNLAAALVAALDDDALAWLAERLRPHLHIHDDKGAFLTPAQVAARLALHPKTVVRMARDGRLPAVKIGTRWRFDPDRLRVESSASCGRALAAPTRPSKRPPGTPASVRAIRGENAPTTPKGS
jgi:excisionase family DNA binding protein